MTGLLRTLIPDHCKFRGLRKGDEKWFLRIGEVTVVLHKSEGRLFYRYSTFCGSSWTRLFPDGPEGGGVGGGGDQSHFPAHFFFEIPLPSAQIPFPLAEFGKNPSVIHTTSFRFASAKLRLLNTTEQRPKDSQGFTKMF